MPALWPVRNSRLREPRIFLPIFTGLLCLPLTFILYLSAAPHPSPVRSGKTAVSATDVNLLIDAEQALIRGCMRRHGFQYWPLPASQAYPAVRFPYVITSVSWARRHGFSGAFVPVASRDPNQRYYSQLTATQQSAYSDALVGSPGSPGVTTRLPTGGIDGHSADGCQATADRQLYGNYAAWFKARFVALDLPGLWQGRVLGDPRYGSAVSMWSSCMRAKGYRYSSPAQAASMASQQTRAAVAEAQCAGSTGLTKVVDALDREYAARVSREYRSSLEAEWRLERNALPRARQVLRTQR
jgi:hypothetical protein